jgi:ATP-dependent Clp protease ATP-binding subunit ClpA
LAVVSLDALKGKLTSYIENDLKSLVTDHGRASRPTAAFQRVMQRAMLDAQGLGRDTTGADLLVAIFAETESHAVWLLGEQDMTYQDAANCILHRIVKGRGGSAV